MPIRNGWRPGRHLVIDDESGNVYYDDQVRKIWDGSIRHVSQYETRHPQEFVKAKNDPRRLTDIRPDTPADTPTNFPGVYVNNTTIPVPQGPASHLFDYGIGQMTVGVNFTVR